MNDDTTHLDGRSSIWRMFTADMQRYVGTELRPWSFRFVCNVLKSMIHSPGAIAVAVYRYGQWVHRLPKRNLLRLPFLIHYHSLYFWVLTRLQIEIYPYATIGPGFKIAHIGGIIINGGVVAGDGLTINHGVILGNQPMGKTPGGVPRLGNNVRIGIDAKIIGDICLGDGVQVGAGAVVTKSFGDNSVIAGVPAKLLYVLDNMEMSS